MYGPFTPIKAYASDGSTTGGGEGSDSSSSSLPWIYQSSEDQLLSLLKMMEALLLYKPPVGATVVAMVLRLLFFGPSNKRFLNAILQTVAEEEQRLDRSGPMKRRKRRRGRSLDLDTTDRLYDSFGGIESVRAKLYSLALQHILQHDFAQIYHSSSYTTATTSTTADNMNMNMNMSNTRQSMEQLGYHIAAALEAVRISCPPRGSRENLVERLAEPLSFLYPFLLKDYNHSATAPATASNTNTNTNTNRNSASPAQQFKPPIMGENIAVVTSIQRWIQQATKVAELRALDALLRTLRDRQLISTARLRRAVDRWSWMVQYSGGGGGDLIFFRGFVFTHLLFPLRNLILGRSIEDDRNDLALAVAAYQQETKLLGQVQQLLLQRPAELSQDTLLYYSNVTTKDTEEDATTTNTATSFTTAFTSSSSSSSSSSSFSNLRSKEALSILERLEMEGSNTKWLQEARDWSIRARTLICDAISITLPTTNTKYSTTIHLTSKSKNQQPQQQQNQPTIGEMIQIKKWCSYDGLSDVAGWNTLITRIDRFAKSRRLGESLSILDSFSTIKSVVRRLDFFGIPSSIGAISLSLLVHNTVRPYWPQIVNYATLWKDAIWGIIEFRFYNPLRDIVLDLLNRRPKLVDPFAVWNEQTSLDNMLRDLGLGDGTAAGRDAAIAAASRLYEQELRKGPIRSILGGNIVRLLLIQVQQLKADLLSAMDSIDVLVDANRLNLQLLAGIPAVLFVTLGVRVFFQWMYSFRSFEIRSIREVHKEMTDYLDRAERLLLLSNRQTDITWLLHSKPTASSTVTSASSRSSNTAANVNTTISFLQPPDLGEFVVLMHSYLVMIDYASPPFSKKACDSIAETVQDIFIQGELCIARQLEILRLIKSKHLELLK
jgi:nuclear-control-of-ATPase protein 2